MQVYPINSTENSNKPEVTSISNSNILNQNLANTESFKQEALQVLTLIDKSKKLREQLPHFVNESNQAIKKHDGALPSSYAIGMAKALSEANELRNSLFMQALTHRGEFYRIDNQIDDKTGVTEIVIAMSAAITHLQLVLFDYDGKLELDNGISGKLDENGLALYEKLVKGKPMPREYNRPGVRSSFSGFL